MISDEMLNKFIENPSDYGPTVIAMAKELLAYRKQCTETYGWVSEYPSQPAGIGGMSYAFHDNQLDAQDEANEFEGFAVEVIRKPAIHDREI